MLALFVQFFSKNGAKIAQKRGFYAIFAVKTGKNCTIKKAPSVGSLLLKTQAVLLFHIQQTECARAAVNGNCRGGLLEVDLVEVDVLFDLVADPVGVALGDAYVGYEEDPRVYVGRVGKD